MQRNLQVQLAHATQRDAVALIVCHDLQRGIFTQQALQPSLQHRHVSIRMRLQTQTKHAGRHLQALERGGVGAGAQRVTRASELEAEDSAYVAGMQLAEG
jgi:hypothetical protein